MMNEELIQKLGEYVAKNILKQPNRSLKPDQPLLSSGLVDSFSVVDISIFVEDTFGVHIDDSELNAETFDTLEELAALIESRSK
jgi:acyl carrier protein